MGGGGGGEGGGGVAPHDGEVTDNEGPGSRLQSGYTPRTDMNISKITLLPWGPSSFIRAGYGGRWGGGGGGGGGGSL